MKNNFFPSHNMVCDLRGPIQYESRSYATEDLKGLALDYAVAQSIYENVNIRVLFLPGGRWERVIIDDGQETIDPWSVTKNPELAKRVIATFHPMKPDVSEINVQNINKMLIDIVAVSFGEAIDLPIQLQKK
jgi:hypothetical protein